MPGFFMFGALHWQELRIQRGGTAADAPHMRTGSALADGIVCVVVLPGKFSALLRVLNGAEGCQD
jgi:hypothetical protein